MSYFKNNYCNRVYPRVINSMRNKGLLETVPHKNYEEMSVVYYYDEPGFGETIVTNEQMLEWNIVLRQIHSDALRNGEKLFPPYVSDLGGFLGHSDGSNPVMVVTNEQKMFGAAVIFYPKYLRSLAKKIGSGFYILPSSIHEVLIIPDNIDVFNAEFLTQMVMDVNRSVVDEDEWLGDQAYHYDMELMVFELASKYDNRIGRK